MKKAASIDIGTNTVLLLVAEIDAFNRITVLDEAQEIPRLGKGVDADGNLAPESMEAVYDAIQKHKSVIDGHGIEKPIITATSAVRDATNRDVFMDGVRERFGWEVRLLSGEEEASMTFTGAVSALPEAPSDNITVLDIGGGSTEFVSGYGNKPGSGISIDMGSVRCKERFLKDDPPTNDQIQQCREFIREKLRETGHPDHSSSLIGVAGTAFTLVVLEHHIEKPGRAACNGLALSFDSVRKWVRYFSETPSNKLLNERPDVMKGRADIILAGALILEESMKYLGHDKLTFSAGGIRYGALVYH